MNTMTIVIAILVALALLGAVAVTVIVITPLAEAACERGNAGSHAFNQSKGRCLDRGTL
jgi:hypothetical protein